jgi:large subunit ribosomal protein L15
MPLVRRVPKRGFHNPFAVKVAIVNVGDLEACFRAGDEVTPQTLAKTPLLGHRYGELKVLGDGALSKPLTVSAHRFSQSAIVKIEQAGGTVVRLAGPVPVEEKKKRAKAKLKAKANV